MVVGGYDDDGNYRDDTQLVELTSGTKSCRNWQKYPIALSSAAGSIISNNSIIVCDGYSDTRHDECYKMDIEEKSWTFLTKMNSKRSYVAAVEVNNKLFVAGGNDNDGALSSTEFISSEG